MKALFDTVCDRKNTNSLKWDFYMERGHEGDELPLWVADMDFKSPGPVIEALQKTAEKGFFGYTLDKEEDRKTVTGWLLRRHGLDAHPDEVVFGPGVVFSMTHALKALTIPGDAVMISEPVYYPFASIVRDTGRKLVRNTLVSDRNGYYRIDFASFEKQIIDHQVKVYFLCSPHNPVGRVWKREELERIGKICLSHGVIVFSDEIHADFVFEGSRHIPFVNVSPDFAENTLTFTSPSKTFNLAGLQIAQTIVHDPEKRAAMKKEISRSGYTEIPVMGLAALKAAYTECDEWVDGLVKYIYENILYMDRYLRERIPCLRMRIPEGTYLPWVDCRALDLDDRRLDALMREKAKLWLDPGFIFGEAGYGYQRFNAACPRSILTEALGRLEKGIQQI